MSAPFMSSDEIDRIGEPFGYFEHKDAQGDVRRAFAQAVIEAHEAKRAAASEMYEALEALVAGIEDAGPVTCGACTNPHTGYCGNTNCQHAAEISARVGRAYAAIAKARGGK